MHQNYGAFSDVCSFVSEFVILNTVSLSGIKQRILVISTSSLGSSLLSLFDKNKAFKYINPVSKMQGFCQPFLLVIQLGANHQLLHAASLGNIHHTHNDAV